MMKAGLAAALAVVALATVATAAQQAGALTLAQLQRKYSGMSAVHIGKCDKDGDGLYVKAEQLCVGSIYQVMYINE